jgi:predicted ABC-type ATPase
LSDKPKIDVIAGPNGAGKTTFASSFLPHFVHCSEFLNADLIAAGLSPFSPESQNVRAGRILLQRIRELLDQTSSSSFETTLAGRSYLRLLSQAKEAGYAIELFFLWLPNVEAAIARVASRIRAGGHNISETDIRRRYFAGLVNLFALYRPIADRIWLHNGLAFPPVLIAHAEEGCFNSRNDRLFGIIEQSAIEASNDSPS